MTFPFSTFASITFVDQVRRFTNGFMMKDRNSSGRTTLRDVSSGEICPSRFGKSSPITIEK